MSRIKSTLLLFLLLFSENTLALDIFQININKRIEKGLPVNRILSKRFSIEIARRNVDFEFNSWLLDKSRYGKSLDDIKLYEKNIRTYIKRCSIENSFGGCLASQANQASHIMSFDEFSVFLKKNDAKSIDKGEFGALSRLYFYYPMNKMHPIFKFLNDIYKLNNNILSERTYLKVLFDEHLLNDNSFLENIAFPNVKTIYQLQNQDKGEISKVCPQILSVYNSEQFPEFSLCILDLARRGKLKLLTPIVGRAYSKDKKNRWLQLLYLMFEKTIKKKNALTPAMGSNKSASNLYFLHYISNKNQTEIKNDENPVGLARLYRELNKTMDQDLNFRKNNSK